MAYSGDLRYVLIRSIGGANQWKKNMKKPSKNGRKKIEEKIDFL